MISDNLKSIIKLIFVIAILKWVWSETIFKI